MAQLSRLIPPRIIGLIAGDVLLIVACYSLAFTIQFADLLFYLEYESGWARLAIAGGTILFGLYLSGSYEGLRPAGRVMFVQQLCLVLGFAFLIQALLVYGRFPFGMPRLSMVSAGLALLILMPLWRSAYSHFALRIAGAEQLLFVGTHDLIWRAVEMLQQRPELGLHAAGFISEGEQPNVPQASTLRWLGSLRDKSTIEPAKFDRLIVGIAEDSSNPDLLQVIQLLFSGPKVQSVSDFYEDVSGRVAVRSATSFDVMRRGISQPKPFNQMLQKRLQVKPGVTGWAQINYRYGNTIEDTVIKLEYDLYYIKNLSAPLDFLIMFHTIKTVLLTRGAY